MRSNLPRHFRQPGIAHVVPALVSFSSPADPAFTSRLSGVLHSLYVIAAVLALLLILSLVVAVWVFRRNRDTEPKA